MPKIHITNNEIKRRSGISNTRKKLFREGILKANKENHPQWKGGKPNCLDCEKKLSNYSGKRCRNCYVTPELREKISKSHIGKHIFSEEQKMMLSKKFKELWKNPLYRAKMEKRVYIFTEEHRRKLREKAGHPHSEETKKILREYRKKQIMPTTHTKPEEKFIKICNKYNLPYIYVGNSSFWIERVNPDFVNCNGKKICVEIFGDYWHNLPNKKKKDEENLNTLKKYGWERIVIWESEINKFPEIDIVNMVITNEKK